MVANSKLILGSKLAENYILENIHFIKGSSGTSHFIFQVNVGKRRIRHSKAQRYSPSYKKTITRKYFMCSVAKGFLLLHGDSDFSMKDQKGPDKLFSTYASLDRETKKRIKNPDKSWSR